MVVDEQLTQTRLLERQNKDFDKLAAAVKRIETLRRDMHVGLEQQGDLLGDLRGRFDGTNGRLQLFHKYDVQQAMNCTAAPPGQFISMRFSQR